MLQDMHFEGALSPSFHLFGSPGSRISGRESDRHSIPDMFRIFSIYPMLLLPPTRMTGTSVLDASSAAKSIKYPSPSPGRIPRLEVPFPLTSIESIPSSAKYRHSAMLSSTSSPPEMKSLQLIFTEICISGTASRIACRISTIRCDLFSALPPYSSILWLYSGLRNRLRKKPWAP